MKKRSTKSMFCCIVALFMEQSMVLGFNDASTEELLGMCSDELDFLDASYVETLLINDADPNARIEPSDMMPLHCAAMTGDYETVRLLCDFGASITAKDKHGWTALHYAATQGMTNRFKKKADSKKCDYTKTIELLFRYDFKRYEQHKKENDDRLEALRQFVPINWAKNSKGNTPLYVALDPHEKSAENEEALMVTSVTGKVIMLLLRNKNFTKQDLEDILITEPQWEEFRKAVCESKNDKEALKFVAIPQLQCVKNEKGVSVADFLKIVAKQHEEHEVATINKNQLKEICQIIEKCDHDK